MRFPLRHPEFVVRNARADTYVERRQYTGAALRTALVTAARGVLGRPRPRPGGRQRIEGASSAAPELR